MVTKRGKTKPCSGSSGRIYRTFLLECTKCGAQSQRQEQGLVSTGCKNGPCNVNFVDLSGRRFGQLVVLKYISKKRGPSTWSCKCDCGEIEIVWGTSLTLQNKRTCRKCSRRRVIEHNTLKQQMSAWHRYWRSTKRNAERAGRAFELSLEEMRKLAQQPCRYCNAQPQVDSLGLCRTGIDRIDNNQGYTVSNSVACCSTCNIMKSRLSVTEWLTHIRTVLEWTSKTFNDYP